MSLFSKIKDSFSTTTATPVNISAESPSSDGDQRAKVILDKSKIGLEKHIVNLKKEKNIDLSAHKARVAVILDRSGSMSTLYQNGSVQETLTRLLPLALKFDDNGELEVYVFDDKYDQVEPMTVNNFSTYVKKEIMAKGFGPRGGTNYAPVIKQVTKDYNDGSQYPAFIIFITDGDNWDHNETDIVVRESSKYKIFFQFVGIGRANFAYLQKLDDLDGRDIDNTSFIKVSDFGRLNDEELFQKLLAEYPQWLMQMNIQ